MLKIAKVFNHSFLGPIYRHYVSIINIKADTVKKIKLMPDEYENSYQADSEIRVEAIDGDKNLIKFTDSNSKITKTKDEYQFEWLDKQEDTSLVFEIPLSSCRDIELSVNVKTKGQIKVDNIPNAKSIELSTPDCILMTQIRSEKCTATASQISCETVYAMVLDLNSPKEDEGEIVMMSCQAEMMRALAKNVNIDSCYTHNVEIKTTDHCLLKNLHGNAKVTASGEVFNTVGFSGTINADSTCQSTRLHFAELVDKNYIKINHPEGFVRAGFANEIVKETTDLIIQSSCPIQTKSKDFVVCHRGENEYEIIRKNPESDSELKIEIQNAKEVHMIKQSWIDSLKFG